MSRFIRAFLLFLFFAGVASAQTSTVNWNFPHQVMQGFGAGNNFIGNAMNPYDSLLLNTLGYSLLRSAVPVSNGVCDGSPSSGCATAQDSVTDMQYCVAHGCSVWVYVSNPPPEYNSSGTVNCTVNPALNPSSYGAYASYISNYLASLKTYESIPPYAISAQNEPDNTSACQMSPSQMDTFIKTNLGPTLSSAGQTSTLIMMPEVEGFFDYTAWAGTCMGDSSCANYVGINAFHGYDNPSSISNPYNKLFWETEVSDIGGPSPRAPGCAGNVWCPTISDALMWSTIISNEINEGLQAWHYFWYVDDDSLYGNDANVALINPAQSPSVALRAYAIANWAKFVRPGWTRVDTGNGNPQSGVYVTAFKDPTSTNVAVVVVNTNGSNVAQTISLTNAPNFSSVTPWITSSTLSLVQQSPVTVSSNSWNFALPASSITTFVGSSSGAGSVTISPSSFAFGNVVQHTTSSGQTTTITNSSGSTITFGLLTFVGSNPSDFPISNNPCTGTLSNGNSCTITDTFNPNAAPGTAESATMDISFTGASGSPLTVSLSGTSIAGGNAHYYVSYTHGSDSSNGTSKGSPWQHAPGMNGVSGNANITPNPGDQIILEGCVIWPNAAFSWVPTGGSSGNPVYYGVDQTWWDSTVSGCASAWNRPVFDLQGMVPSDSLYRIIGVTHSYLTLDNFEIKDMLNQGSSGNGGTDVFDWGDGSQVSAHVQNMYVHGVINKYFAVGTGNLTSGQSTITNFVPYSYSPAASQAFLNAGTAGLPCNTAGCNGGIQLQTFCGGIPEGNGTPTVTAITGSNPYTLTYTNTAGPNSGNFTGCVVWVGNDYLTITGGINGPTTDDIMQNNVIDLQDSAEWEMNPYEDCGLTESNNNFCIGQGTVDWRLPNVWRNNVIRNVASVAVAECQEWSGNLIEYIRLSINPTAHTNVIECEGYDNPVNSASFYYNNVIRHTNNPNPNTPAGRYSVGLGNIGAGPNSGNTAYIFNNVMYDTLQNSVIERQNSTSGAFQVTFNNSGDCGPSWDLTHTFSNPLVAGDTYYNNYCATTNATPLSCSGLICATNLFPTPSAATAAGYTENQTYAYSPPTSGSPTVSTGTNYSFCSSISASQSAAGTACLYDTAYAVAWNQTTHQVTGPGRTVILRPSTPSIGAYEFGSGPPPSAPNPPTGLMATVTSGGGGIALISHTSAQYAGTNNYSTTGINTVGATLLVAGTCSTSGNAPTVSDAQHNVWQTTATSTGGFTSQIVYAYAPSTGASDVFSVDQVTPGATGSSITVAAFSGTLSTSGVLDGQSAHNTAANSATVQPGTISPAQAAELFFTNVCSADTGTTFLGVDSSFSVLDNHNPTSAASSATSAYLVLSGSSAQNPTWTDNFSGNWLTSSMASFK